MHENPTKQTFGLQNQEREAWEATCVRFAYHPTANINRCMYIKAGRIVLEGLREREGKKKITLKISLKSGNHALPQDWRGLGWLREEVLTS